MWERAFRGILKRWLRERALRLPDEDVEKIAKKLNVPREVVVTINEAIIDWILRQLG